MADTPAPAVRKHTEVAVGILFREDGAMLLTSRPEGKPYAGYWEFQGVSWRLVSRWSRRCGVS